MPDTRSRPEFTRAESTEYLPKSFLKIQNAGAPGSTGRA